VVRHSRFAIASRNCGGSKPGGLLPNPKSWRRHPPDQVNALRGLLAEIGYADALLARELPDGRFMIVDG